MEVSKRLTKIKVNNIRDAIKLYLSITKPGHKLKPREIEIVAELCFVYYENKHRFTEDIDAWAYVFDYDQRIMICDTLGIQKNLYEVYLTSIRKKGAIKNNRVLPNYSLPFDKETKAIEILFRLDIDGQEAKDTQSA